MVTRRDFVKGAAAGVVGLASVGLFAGCSQESSSKAIKWDKEADVVIVGGGGAGLAAAVQAATDGAKVMVLEKAGITGGTTTLSGGVMQAAGTDAQKSFSKYKEDTPEKHFQLWLKAGEGYVDEELVRDLAYSAPEHIKWLSETIGLKFTSVYGHSTIPYVDKSLFADRIHVYEGGGEGGGGGVMTKALLKAAKDKAVAFEFNAEVTKLISNAAGEVIGVSAKQKDAQINVKAKKGVILAAASIDHNEEMAKRLSPQQYWDITVQKLVLVAITNTGDGIRMATEIGADVRGFGGTIDFCGKTGNGTSNLNPTFPTFFVNKMGRRFVNEETTYAYHYRAIFEQEKQLDGPTYMIFGKSSLSAKGSAWTADSVAKDVTDKVVVTANTIEQLAELIGVNPANLANALAAWNSDVKSGKDNAFGRVQGLAAIEGPFYAYKNTSFNLGSLGGVRINVDTQALKPNGEVIPRLYAAGLNAGGWIGPYYPGSGTAVMGCVHWGRKAGASAAKMTALS